MNKIIKYKILSTIFIFLLTVIVHFGYNVLKCDLTAIFFPVNESIWEHMKMLFTSFIIYGVIEYFINKYKGLKLNNIVFNALVTSFITIFVFLIMFLPFYYRFGENFVITIIMEFISIAISQIISYFILTQKRFNLDKISIVLIIVCYIIFGYLTYNPPLNDFFFDPKNEKYGINTYQL